MKRHSQSGVALVITLVLLSVITFMAVTFLVVSRHEAAQVSTLTQQSNAKFAADAAVEQAKAFATAQMLAFNNGFNLGILVSTNYVSAQYIPLGQNTLSITNVSYNGIASAGDLQRMLANQLILPRAPVFIVTNKNFPNNPDFRFYLDLNRNGRFDTNGWVAERDNLGNVIKDPNNPANPLTNFFVGDPEWIGILNHPEQPHSSSNLYVARYCFIALPIGSSLDLNYIHNQSQELSMNLGQDGGYLRNQGVGTWEINLAGFLAALNTNIWPIASSTGGNYQYAAENNFNFNPLPSSGYAFSDAAAVVQYRYNRNYGNVKSFPAMYPGNNLAANFIARDGIDDYAVGPLMTNFSPLVNEGDYGAIYKASPPKAWSGADNPAPLVTSQDLFGTIPSPTGSPLLSLTNRLYLAGRYLDTYDQYTYYRMLSQMSVGSAPDSAPALYNTFIQNGQPVTLLNSNYSSIYASLPKMNLNYNNVDYNTTNFVPWTPARFFTNAADRMLRAYFPTPVLLNINGILTTNSISITNIPIYPVNMYTPAIHRILQLAANMYDASTNKNTGIAPNDFDFPSVFQPYFRYTKTALVTNIWIAGYNEITNANVQTEVFTPPKDFRRQFDLTKFLSSGIPFVNNIFTVFNVNVYGIPYVIGAKKGLPSFNKFSTAPMIQVSRKMQIAKNGSLTSANWVTNIQYYVGVSNLFGVECWYPYTNSYMFANRGGSGLGLPGVNIYITNEMTYGLMMTNNGVGFAVGGAPINYSSGTSGYFPTNGQFTWYGSPNLAFNSLAPNPNSFKEPLNSNIVMWSDSLVHLRPLGVIPATNLATPVQFETTGPGYFLPRFYLGITNRIRAIIQDRTSGRILDYVQLGGYGQIGSVDTVNDIMTDLTQVSPPYNTLWSTNPIGRIGSPPLGVLTEYNISLPYPVPNYLWSSVSPPIPNNSVQAAQTAFQNALSDSSQNTVAVPYSIISKYYAVHTWAVNDPLVHYTIGDLTDTTTPVVPLQMPFTATNVLSGVFGVVKTNRYQPWRHTDTRDNPLLSTVNGATELAYKDPLMTYSDNWQFPSSKLPNVGWLGRVHRGTPWQSVYLKSMPVSTNVWPQWTGDLLTNYFSWTYNGINYTWNDPLYSVPTNDWILMDLFTTAPNDNATRGQLSVNQTNFAAWAAVLDGVIVATNRPTGLAPWFIDPSQLYTIPGTSITTNTVQYIANQINAARVSTNADGSFVFPQATFTSAGQLLSVPALTVASPYLDTTTANANLLNDEAYEAIPQQIMSLVRLGTPRYVIFAYGQSLKPADHSIVQSSGPFFGMPTNYTITGEVATRTVVRFDNPPVPGMNPTSPRAVIESFNVLGPE